jgi:hypothetical protein
MMTAVKIMDIYLKGGFVGREFIHVLKTSEELDCFISYKYEINKRKITEIIVVEAESLKMLGNIVKSLSNYISKVNYSSFDDTECLIVQAYLQDMLEIGRRNEDGQV